MSLKKVLIANKSYPIAGLEVLKNKVIANVIPSFEYEAENLPTIKRTVANGYDALIWNTKHRLNADILNLAGPQLKAVTTMSAGLDHIDVEELKKRGIVLGHTPKALDSAVADIAIGLLIAAARRFKEGIQDMVNGDVKYGVNWMLGQDVSNSTVGIIGLGGLGQAIVRRLKGFDVARFIYCGRSDKLEAKVLGVVRVSLDQLLMDSDFVILSCPLTSETKHLINANTLRKMKKSAVLVNIARGEVVDQEALIEALKEKRIFAAGLDVATPEPLPKENPLISLPNCFVIPHLGTATIQTRNNMATTAANNVLLALEGKPILSPAY